MNLREKLARQKLYLPMIAHKSILISVINFNEKYNEIFVHLLSFLAIDIVNEPASIREISTAFSDSFGNRSLIISRSR